MTLSELKTLITVAEVKAALDDQLFESLTYGRGRGTHGDPEAKVVTNVQFAVQASARWGYSRLIGAGAQNRAFSADSREVIREALIKRAVYELGRTQEFKENFDMDREDADTMMDAVLGLSDGSSDGDNTNSAGYVGAAGAQYVKGQSCHAAVFTPPLRRR
ncbi:MAG: hypothetical protein ACK5JN_06335 [Kluyvera sp.]|uniref:hypothetical protein n=1 Tax=Kluyvera sp. TaxID=1538228 RepID=UPI003A85CCE1